MERARQPILPYFAVLALLVTAIAVRPEERTATVSRSAVESLLRRELGARVGAVHAWEVERRSEIEAIADAEDLRAALDGPRLAGALARACAGFEGCAVTRADGAILASHEALAVPRELTARAARGRTAQSRLLVTEASPSRFAVWFATPVVERGVVRALVAGWVYPDEDLDPILGALPPGRTGETYAVDRRGYMITRPRFDAAARHPRGAPRVLGRPGAWARTPANDPTVALASLDRGGSDVHGYLDYRGVRVVGAWRWLDDLGAGVITEIDAVEAFHLASR